MDVARHFYPEIGAGGFSRVDGTVEFYGRVNALLRPEMVVLDFGAGRAWHAEDECAYRRDLQSLRGKVRKVVGADLDPVVKTNPTLDQAVVLEEDRGLPFPDESFDLILSDATLEHVETPSAVVAELDRVLRPGGWICARTPNRWGYIGVGANLAPNRLHAKLLRRLQPHREARDVFPTRYRMNTLKALERLFPPERFEHFSYARTTEPAYFGNSRFLWQLMLVVNRATPPRMEATLFVFLRKRP
ncbi:MAG TPA: class I SAM-dependent methyltransferase [Acidimicrobiales bacterium]|nr:class I SAM-dependent methyltransferase [Acidimicrobiales bacterium]